MNRAFSTAIVHLLTALHEATITPSSTDFNAEDCLFIFRFAAPTRAVVEVDEDGDATLWLSQKDKPKDICVFGLTGIDVARELVSTIKQYLS